MLPGLSTFPATKAWFSLRHSTQLILHFYPYRMQIIQMPKAAVGLNLNGRTRRGFIPTKQQSRVGYGGLILWYSTLKFACRPHPHLCMDPYKEPSPLLYMQHAHIIESYELSLSQTYMPLFITQIKS